MGRATTKLKNKLKGLSKKPKKSFDKTLNDKEIVADCDARIRQCEVDMKNFGDNNVIKAKIADFKLVRRRALMRLRQTELEKTTKEVK